MNNCLFSSQPCQTGVEPLTERQEDTAVSVEIPSEIQPSPGDAAPVCEPLSERAQLLAHGPQALNAVKTGLRSQLLQEAGAPWRAEQIASITADLGEDVSTLKAHTIDQVGTVLVVLRFLSENLMALGPLTGKGRQRAALTAYMQTLDRYMRLTQQLGLDRVGKQVVNPADWLDGKA